MNKRRTPRQPTRKELARINAIREEDIDYSDNPATDAAFWANARIVDRRTPKKSISIRLDADLIEWFRNQSDNYQTLMRAVLSEYKKHHEDDDKIQKT